MKHIYPLIIARCMMHRHVGESPIPWPVSKRRDLMLMILTYPNILETLTTAPYELLHSYANARSRERQTRTGYARGNELNKWCLWATLAQKPYSITQYWRRLLEWSWMLNIDISSWQSSAMCLTSLHIAVACWVRWSWQARKLEAHCRAISMATKTMK